MTLPPINCGSCRLCCLGEPVELEPGDNPAMYKTKLVDGRRVLAKGKDGNCIYLTKAGCSIHGRAPRRCKDFDCRKYALRVRELSEAEQASRHANPSTQPTLAEGERRLAA